MARLIYQTDSTTQHLRMGRRHIRLCERVAGAKKYVAGMQATLNKLKEKEKERKDAVEAKEDAHDDIVFCDTGLDNAIRTLFERARQHDRDNPGRVLEMLFPNRAYSDIVRMPMSKEPQEAGKLSVKLESLAEGHELRQLIEPLRQRINASKEAWEALERANTRLKEIQATEELAKLTVRQRYEHDYLDARKEFGATLADSIFPKIARKPVVSHEEEPQVTEEGE